MKKRIVFLVIMCFLRIYDSYSKGGMSGGHSSCSHSSSYGSSSHGSSYHISESHSTREVRSFSHESNGIGKSFSRYYGKSFAKSKTITSSGKSHHEVSIQYSKPVYFYNPYYHFYYYHPILFHNHDSTAIDTNAFNGFGKGRSGGAGASERNFGGEEIKTKKDSMDIMDIQPINYLSDFSGVIPDADEPKINSMIRQYKKKTGVEIAVVIIPTLGEEVNIDDYAQLLFDHWGIGEKDINNGVLILITTEDGMMRIQSGYGLEEILTDAGSRDIEDEIMIPQLTNKKWEAGIINGITAIITKFGSGPIESTKNAYKVKHEKEREDDRNLMIAVLFLIVIFFGWQMWVHRD